ncbi:endonuclease [Streptomyces sp. NPDC038707]|uniref:endonuclease n=1 Tax=Streptomyces sp. NPDC038707 TaxID=3154329 RepID=UPI0033FA5BD1
MNRDARVLRELVSGYGRTFAEEAGIPLKDTPQSLYRLLVLSLLLSARIRTSVAVAAACALHDEGLDSPRRMADAGRRRRVDALGRAGYRRYDERTAAQLGDGAELIEERWGGDLRRLHREAEGDVGALRELLQEEPGIGPAGAGIFLREAQRVWPDVAPYLDGKALSGAGRLGLPEDPERLTALAGDTQPAVLAAALVRAALDRQVAEECLRRAG